MLALATIPLTCWVCAWLARPHKPRYGDEVQELVYGRLLGRQGRLTLLALILTAGMLLGLAITLPQRIDGTFQSVRGAHAECAAEMTDATTARCFELEAGGIWVEKEYQRDIGWHDIAPVSAPIAPEQTIHGSKP
jgi:hypothetical protein